MKNYYWTENSFGTELPENWEEMCYAANSAIDAYISANGLDPEADEEEISRYSEKLFEFWTADERFPDLPEITNSEGKTFTASQWDAITAMMDDDIREDLASELAPCSNQEFFTAYAAAHLEKFGEVWELDKANPTW